jgi:hypothetical protein
MNAVAVQRRGERVTKWRASEVFHAMHGELGGFVIGRRGNPESDVEWTGVEYATPAPTRR